MICVRVYGFRVRRFSASRLAQRPGWRPGVSRGQDGKTTFDLFGGGSFEQEYFSPNPPTVLTSLTRKSGEILAGEELNTKLNSRMTLSERFALYPNLSNAGNYRYQFDASAATKMKKWLSWQITFSDRFLSDPLPGLKKNDLLLTTGVRLTFGKGGF
jgi:hypothetical protein